MLSHTSNWQHHASIQKLKTINLRSNSRDKYLNVIKLFLLSVYPEGITQKNVNRFLTQPTTQIEQTIIKYIDSLTGYTERTRNQYLSVLKIWVRLSTPCFLAKDCQNHSSIQNFKKLDIKRRTYLIYAQRIQLFLKSIFSENVTQEDINWFLAQPPAKIEEAIVKYVDSLDYRNRNTKYYVLRALRFWVKLSTDNSFIEKLQNPPVENWQNHPSIQKIKTLKAYGTYLCYISHIKIFLQSIFLDGCTSTDLDRFLSQPVSQIEATIVKHINSLEYFSIGTKYQRIVALKIWIDLAIGHSLLQAQADKFYILNLYTAKTSSSLNTVHSEELIATLKKINLNKFQGKRNYAIILLIWTTNIEKKELVGLKIKDLDLPNKQIKLQNQWKTLSDSTWIALKKLLNVRQELTPEDFVFTCSWSSRVNKPLSWHSMHVILASYGFTYQELIRGSIKSMLELVSNNVDEAIEIAPNGQKKINNKNIQLLEKQLLT